MPKRRRQNPKWEIVATGTMRPDTEQPATPHIVQSSNPRVSRLSWGGHHGLCGGLSQVWVVRMCSKRARNDIPASPYHSLATATRSAAIQPNLKDAYASRTVRWLRHSSIHQVYDSSSVLGVERALLGVGGVYWPPMSSVPAVSHGAGVCIPVTNLAFADHSPTTGGQ